MFLALPYNRSFKSGRASEQLFNEELHKMYEAIRHITDDPGPNAQPEAKLHGSLWGDERTNRLLHWDKTKNQWKPFFEREHKITSEILSVLPPSDPVRGQLWMHNGVLCYYDGTTWNPIKALIQDGSQFSLDVFKNFILLSPLWQSGNTCANTNDMLLGFIVHAKTVRIDPQGEVSINESNLDKKFLNVLVLNQNQSEETYGKYINSEGVITVEYKDNEAVLHNETDSSAIVKISYITPKENDDMTSSGTLTGINWELISSETIEEFKHQERMYLQGVLDTQTDSAITGDGTKWRLGHNCITNDPEIPVVSPEAMSQLLVPQIDYARVFLDRDLDNNWVEVSKVCIQYPRKDIINHIPSLVHINPGRLTKITKRIVKIDRTNPKILIPAGDTEYYGFHEDSPFGELLVPDISTEKFCDYTVIDEGILLSYNACQHFDYVLAIHYDFSWMKTTGRMVHSDSRDMESTYIIEDFNGPVNMFVEGYDLEKPYFKEDAVSSTITFTEDVKNLEISAIRTPANEYGYIRNVNIKGEAIIRPLRKYTKPLVFINGEIVHPKLDGMKFNADGTISIPGGKQDMMWSIVDAAGTEYVNGVPYKYVAAIDSGVVNAAGQIPYSNSIIPDVNYSNAILFIDGLLIKKEDIIIDRTNHIITVKNAVLSSGQQYVLIEDKYQWFYDSVSITPALAIGILTDTLVYMNGKLLCNDTAIDTIMSVDDVAGVFNEIKCFKAVYVDTDGKEKETRNYKIYDQINEKWVDINSDTKVINAIKKFAYSYVNARKSVNILIPHTSEDEIHIYAFNTANAIEYPLEIDNIIADYDHPILTVGSGMYWDKTTKKEKLITEDKNWVATHVDVPNPTAAQLADPAWVKQHLTHPNWNKLITPYMYGKNTLRVWLNGIRQYPQSDKCDGIIEQLDGNAFKLPEPFIGQITYIVEYPENNQNSPCTIEILDHNNVKNGYINFYKTEQSLFPGRVTIYINGIRQPLDAFTIFDNNTLLINDNAALIGNINNYPTETLYVDQHKAVTLTRNISDKILVEVRQDERIETDFTIDSENFYGELSIDKYGLDRTILEASDEILIFIDGMFSGSKLNNGYRLYPYRGAIFISNEDANNIIRSDSEHEYLIGHRDEHASYLIKYGSDYEHDNANIILEWR